jgi:hypothetical protein
VAARRRSPVEMTSPLDSFTILCRRFVGIFHLSLIIEKLFEFIDLAGNLPFGFQNMGFWMVLTPKGNFI